MQRIVPCLVLVFAGCGGTTSPAIPPTAGDFVKNNDGVGTAKVFGINFRVSVDASGASTEDSIHASFTDADQSIARKCFTLGDDITIQLDSVDQSVARFTFNDVDYGHLNVGDNVVIDNEHRVEVNGTRRSPAAEE